MWLEMQRILGSRLEAMRKNHKSTYVTLTSLSAAQELAQRTVDEALAALAVFGSEASFLRELVSYLVNRKQ